MPFTEGTNIVDVRYERRRREDGTAATTYTIRVELKDGSVVHGTISSVYLCKMLLMIGRSPPPSTNDEIEAAIALLRQEEMMLGNSFIRWNGRNEAAVFRG
jgi:hypothetical protein